MQAHIGKVYYRYLVQHAYKLYSRRPIEESAQMIYSPYIHQFKRI